MRVGRKRGWGKRKKERERECKKGGETGRIRRKERIRERKKERRRGEELESGEYVREAGMR